MSFDYDKAAGKHDDHNSFWTSYADLFMMLSIVFLLMYVASSLRQGTAGFQQQVEYKKLSKKAEDLEQQIRVYNTLKDEALRTQSTEQEQATYQKLMGHLDLLQDQAQDESSALEKRAKALQDKKFALNQYQQLVRNIINTNVLAKSQIVNRDKIIVTKNMTIEEKKQQIARMEQIVAQNEAQIEDINEKLEDRIEALRKEQERSRITKAEAERRISKLKAESAQAVASLEAKNSEVERNLGEVLGTLKQTETQLQSATETIAVKEQTIAEKEQAIAQTSAEKDALAAKLEADKARYAAELAQQQQEHANRLAAEQAAFEAKLGKERLSAAARAKKHAEFLADAERKRKELEAGLAGLKGKISDTEQQLAGEQARLAAAQNALQGTQSKLAGAEAEKARALAAVEDLKGDLARTRAIANARKQLAKQISDNFAKAGIKASVDGRTGEVTIDFGQDYFDTGSTALKPTMALTLDKFIPIYAKSLFNDPAVADKIANVEVVGFASSTYKGKYVNPKSVKPEDKDAINYNLNLSFGRANSIFKHVLNQGNLSKADREKLLPLMKVVGRGYLPDGANASDIPDGMPEKDFCKKYNCQKAQKVIVKFNMKD